MLFYEIIGEDNRPAYEADLAAAHKVAKCKRPYALVSIDVIDVDTSKAGVLRLLQNQSAPVYASHTGKRYTLTPRGGLKQGE